MEMFIDVTVLVVLICITYENCESDRAGVLSSSPKTSLLPFEGASAEVFLPKLNGNFYKKADYPLYEKYCST